MFVDFLWTDVSSLLPFLVMFIPTEDTVVCSATSMCPLISMGFSRATHKVSILCYAILHGEFKIVIAEVIFLRKVLTSLMSETTVSLSSAYR